MWLQDMADVLQHSWFAQPAAGVGPQQGWLRFHWWLKELAGIRYRTRDKGSWRGGRRWRQGPRRGLDNAVICCFCAKCFYDRRTTSSAAIGPLLVRIDVLTNTISSSCSWVIGACSPPTTHIPPPVEATRFCLTPGSWGPHIVRLRLASQTTLHKY